MRPLSIDQLVTPSKRWQLILLLNASLIATVLAVAGFLGDLVARERALGLRISTDGDSLGIPLAAFVIVVLVCAPGLNALFAWLGRGLQGGVPLSDSGRGLGGKRLAIEAIGLTGLLMLAWVAYDAIWARSIPLFGVSLAWLYLLACARALAIWRYRRDAPEPSEPS